MFQLLTYLAGIIFVLINSTKAQLDPRVCPGPPPSPVVDANWRSIPPRFEIMAELIAEDGLMELSQAFSPTRDSLTTASAEGGSVQFYWDFNTNEQFAVGVVEAGPIRVPACFRSVITPQSKTSVIGEKSLILKPSVLLGYNERNQINVNWGITYIGDGELRGIPTNKFKSCFHLNDIQGTVSVLYHVSDVNKFQAYLPANESIILQLEVNVTAPSSRVESYTYNVFRYTPNPNRREERQALETPTGVYCANRTSTKDVPSDIPDRVSTNSELSMPTLNNSIISTHSLYDTEFQFTRFDAWYPDPFGGPRWHHYTELHDFAVGLSYHYNHSNHRCTVTDINTGFNDGVTVDDNPSLIQMGDPQHLFLMDDIQYQYTGEKRCRDRVWCHVWIGEKPMPNNTIQHREWYWAARINGEELTQWIPIKFVLRQSLAGFVLFSFESTAFNFRRNPFTVFEIDQTLAECYRSLGPAENYNLAVLSFVITNNKNYPVLENLNFLRLHIFETLIFTMFVRPTRISHLIVDKDGNDILVTFTLLDAPPRTGPVEAPLKESSIDTLVERLSSIIDSNGLAFRAKYGTKQVVLRARAQSLNVNHRTTVIKKLTSGPRITGLWIGLIIVGILVGAVGGFIVFAKLARK